jgi:hypothetical protein
MGIYSVETFIAGRIQARCAGLDQREEIGATANNKTIWNKLPAGKPFTSSMRCAFQITSFNKCPERLDSHAPLARHAADRDQLC